MLKGLVHGLAWSLATGAAVTLSWWGVHTVMAGTAYDPPRAVSIAGGGRSDRTEALSSSTHRPEPSPSHTAAPKKPAKPAPSSHRPSSSPAKSKKPQGGSSSAPDGSGSVKSYNTDGGRVVFDLGAADATLVSATPASGWSMQVWNEPEWIRVEFSRGEERASVFCTWNGHPPLVQIATY